SLDAINEKLIRRHPHIFADSKADTADEVLKRWEEIKQDEKKAKKLEPKLLLESIPTALPALVEAQQISSRAARVGFDWQNPEQVLEKLDEELKELAEARSSATQEEIEGELGDML